MKDLNLLLPVFENVAVKNGCIFAVKLISSPGSKIKVSYISLLFWLIRVRKMGIFVLSLLIYFSVAV